jgi:hypothetical protein
MRPAKVLQAAWHMMIPAHTNLYQLANELHEVDYWQAYTVREVYRAIGKRTIITDVGHAKNR